MYAKIKDQLKAEDWSLEEEEFEDADGNVLSKKMYNDPYKVFLLETNLFCAHYFSTTFKLSFENNI